MMCVNVCCVHEWSNESKKWLLKVWPVEPQLQEMMRKHQPDSDFVWQWWHRVPWNHSTLCCWLQIFLWWPKCCHQPQCHPWHLQHCKPSMDVAILSLLGIDPFQFMSVAFCWECWQGMPLRATGSLMHKQLNTMKFAVASKTEAIAIQPRLVWLSSNNDHGCNIDNNSSHCSQNWLSLLTHDCTEACLS